MFLSALVALRFLTSVRRQGFLSVITILSLLGVILGVGSLIVVLSAMRGLEDDLLKKIVGLEAHLTVTKLEGLRLDPVLRQSLAQVAEVEGVMPYLQGEVLASAGDRAQGAILRGIDLGESGAVLSLPKDRPFEGACMGLSFRACLLAQGQTPHILLGAELSNYLRLYDRSSAEVTLLSPQGQLGPFGYEPHQGRFLVLDRFRSGYYEFDTHMIFAPLAEVQRFFGLHDSISGYAMRLRDLNHTVVAKANIEQMLRRDFAGLSGLRVETWQEKNERLFAALELERLVMFFVLLLVVVVASMVILVTLLLLVSEKSAALAILRTLGMAEHDIRRTFLMVGFWIGMGGALLGGCLGLGVCELLDRYQLLELPSQYYETTIPILYNPWEIGIILAAAIILALLAAWYPAAESRRVVPIEWLRND